MGLEQFPVCFNLGSVTWYDTKSPKIVLSAVKLPGIIKEDVEIGNAFSFWSKMRVLTDALIIKSSASHFDGVLDIFYNLNWQASLTQSDVLEMSRHRMIQNLRQQSSSRSAKKSLSKMNLSKSINITSKRLPKKSFQLVIFSVRWKLDE